MSFYPQKIALLEKIKAAYSGSVLKTTDIYNRILTVEAIDMPGLIDVLVLDNGKALADVKDTTAPVGGSFIITTDGINETTTTSTTSVTLSITCPVEDGVEMFISGTGLSTGGKIWENCIINKDIILTDGDEVKNITIKFRDNLENESDLILHDIDYTLVIAKDTVCQYGTSRWVNTTVYSDSIFSNQPINTWVCFKNNTGKLLVMKRNTGTSWSFGSTASSKYSEAWFSNDNGINWVQRTIPPSNTSFDRYYSYGTYGFYVNSGTHGCSYGYSNYGIGNNIILDAGICDLGTTYTVNEIKW